MSTRDELAEVIYQLTTENTFFDHKQLADAILAAGYRKPCVVGYIVVDRGGIMVGNQHKYIESAQSFADEWTADCKESGIDWDYRVATITEAQP